METFGYEELWHQHYVESYLRVVQDEAYGGTIAAQLFGHVHADEIRLLPESPTKESHPILLSGAISPVYQNNPSFKIVEPVVCVFRWRGKLPNIHILFSFYYAQ